MVEAQVNDQSVPRGEPYDWSYRISVPSGGLVERTDPFAFEAPAGGYHPSDEFRFPASLGRSGWNDTAAKEYFVQTGDGRYARIKFEMIVGGQVPFYVLEAYFNPTVGDRNLEAGAGAQDNASAP